MHRKPRAGCNYGGLTTHLRMTTGWQEIKWILEMEMILESNTSLHQNIFLHQCQRLKKKNKKTTEAQRESVLSKVIQLIHSWFSTRTPLLYTGWTSCFPFKEQLRHHAYLVQARGLGDKKVEKGRGSALSCVISYWSMGVIKERGHRKLCKKYIYTHIYIHIKHHWYYNWIVFI